MPKTESLDELISKKAVEFADQIKAAASMADKEEEIRIEAEKQLAFIQREAGIKLEGKHEFTVASGRVDSVYSRVIIEYKNPKSPGDHIGPKTDSPGSKKVIEQLKKRFYDMRREHRQPLNSLFGVGLDGNHFIFVRFRDEKWQVQEPVEVTKYSAERFLVGKEPDRIIENAKRDGMRILLQKEGSQSAGFICKQDKKSIPSPLLFQTGKNKDGEPIYATIPVRYNLVLNESLSREAIYATMVHELAHLYCGHLGTPNENWWPDRRGLTKEVHEFEAESITHLICRRLNIDNPSDAYLSSHLKQNQEVPPISLECIMKATGLLEKMGQERLKLRKGREG